MRPSGSNISVYEPNMRTGGKRDPSSSFYFPEDEFEQRKKSRREFDCEEGSVPSRVLFVRNLPRDVTEHDVATLAVPFGPLSNLVLTRKSGQALLEMVHLNSASDMLRYYTTIYAPRIRDKIPLRFDYSKYTVLNTIPPSLAISEAISLANRRHLDVISSSHSVILAQVDHAPPTVFFGYRQFFQLFNCFGEILRIIAFRGGSTQKALVEFEQPVSAIVAVMQADGTNFTPDDAPSDVRCNLRVELSRLPTLEVRQEDENCRDFTRRVQDPYYSMPPNGMFHPFRGGDSPNPTEAAPLNRSNSSVLDFLSEERLNSLDPNTLSELASRMVKPLLKAALDVGGQQSTFLRSQAEVLEHLCPQSTPPMLPRVQQTTLLGAYSNSSQTHSVSDDSFKSTQSSVVYVKNLNQERANPDALFTLFGVYGDVQRVKLFHNRKDAALIQFTDATQAQRAVQYLDNLPLYGKIIRCSISKNPSVNIPTSGSKDPSTGEDIALMNNRIYSNSDLHRFRNANSRNLQNVCPPSRVLYVSQLNDQVSEEDLVDAFERISGYEPEVVKLIRLSKPMALVQMKNLEQAVSALIALDNYEIDDNTRIRVCFSKSPIRQ